MRDTNANLTGRDINVALTESIYGGGGYDFEVEPEKVGQPLNLFKWASFYAIVTGDPPPNAAGDPSRHANEVGNIFFGNPGGVSSGVNLVVNYETVYFGSLVGPEHQLLNQEKVVNQSFGFDQGQDDGRDREWDRYVTHFSTIFVSALGNTDYPPVGPESPATAYNGLGVAAYGEGNFSEHGPTGDGRSKPDITAPERYTSYSAPQVSGAAAILLQAAALSPSPTPGARDPRTIKALLLNGAVKPLYERDHNYRWRQTRDGVTRPLDIYHGAGILNVFNSYRQLQAGRHAPGAYGNVASGWYFRAIAEGSAETYTFTLAEGRYDATATLVWHRKRNETVTGINNLNLCVFSGGIGASCSDEAAIASSVSTVDNVEHLFLRSLPAGTYHLRVERTDNVVDGDDDYALAFNFAAIQSFTAASRLTHSGVGAFDVPLPLTGLPGIESRFGSGANRDQYQVVFTFPVAVTAVKAVVSDGTAGATLVAGDERSTTKTVNLTGVGDQQQITVALIGVENGSNMSDVAVQMGVLVGDANGDGTVNSGDAQVTRNRSGQLTDGTNFRTDYNLDGTINSGDATIVRTRSGNTIPGYTP